MKAWRCKFCQVIFENPVLLDIHLQFEHDYCMKKFILIGDEPKTNQFKGEKKNEFKTT
jgi:metal-responsive CopG/Arc/MetJ family transcriptional regulator